MGSIKLGDVDLLIHYKNSRRATSRGTVGTDPDGVWFGTRNDGRGAVESTGATGDGDRAGLGRHAGGHSLAGENGDGTDQSPGVRSRDAPASSFDSGRFRISLGSRHLLGAHLAVAARQLLWHAKRPARPARHLIGALHR